MKNLMFLASLPRTGSTLLASILNQHPKIYASGSSPLSDLIFQTDVVINNLRHNYEIPKERELNIYRGIFNSFYEDVDKELILDKHRAWIKNFNGLSLFFKNPKMIFTIRPISDIIASYLKLVDKNTKLGKSNFIDDDLKARRIDLTNENRAMYLWTMMNASDGPLYNLEQIVNENKDRILFVQYDDIISNTQETLNRVLDFCEMEQYDKFDFNNVVNINPELDENGWNMHGLHDIRETIGKESIPLENYVNASTANFFNGIKLPK